MKSEEIKKLVANSSLLSKSRERSALSAQSLSARTCSK